MEGDAGSGRLTPAEDEGASTTADEARPEGSEDDDVLPAASDPTASTDDDEAPGPRSPLYSRGWVIGVAATLLVLALALAGVGVLARLADDDMQTRNADEAAAVQAAKDCVIATQAPDLATMEASQRKIVECGTGDFGAQAVLYSGILVDAYQAAQAQVQVSNIRAAAERHNDDGTVDVLVALRVKVSNSTVQDQETGYRLRVQMAPEDGTYKIAQLDQVTR